jgi:hypothetical protein
MGPSAVRNGSPTAFGAGCGARRGPPGRIAAILQAIQPLQLGVFRMKRLLYSGLAALVASAALTTSAHAVAVMIAPAPIPQRVALADVVVVGKVTGFADKNVKAAQVPGDKDKAEYQVALVEVKDGVLGAKGMKEIRVGFIPPAAGNPGGPIRPGRRGLQFSLQVEQECCLFLTKHPDVDFYIATGTAADVINKKDNDAFDKTLDEVKSAVKLTADPMEALKGKSAEDRTTVAEMLISRYRMPRPMTTGEKTEKIDAEESKLILQALADADWTEKNPGPRRPGLGFPLSPQNSFFQLNLTEKEGWKPPQDLKDLPEAAKKWLKDNAGKYRIERFVAEEKKDDKKDK